jgi:hypothetical protein
MKNPCPFYLSVTLCLSTLFLTGCFQPVELGETYVEKGTAHLRVTNVSADESYVLEGLELRNPEGAVLWEGLNLSKGQSWEANMEMAGTFTLWYRVKDTWISASEVKPYEGGQVEIVLNKSHEFAFEGGAPDAAQDDFDNDGYPDAWERENGFDPADPLDGGPVYVSRGVHDDADGNGTRDHPYKTLAKAVVKAGRGLSPAIRTVMVLDDLDQESGNDQNSAYPGRPDSVFYLGKTRNPVTIQPADLSTRILTAGASGKRVLYLDTGANIILKNMTITGGKGSGGGIYASGATLTLGYGTTVTGNNAPLPADLTGILGGGILMERGVLVMEPGSSVNGNNAFSGGGVRVVFSTLTMDGAVINNNYAAGSAGGLTAGGCTVKMLSGAAISHNTAGDASDTTTRGRNSGGAIITSSSVFTMHSGSSISYNTVHNGFGGGVDVGGESTLIMEAGSEISHNTCSAGGENSGNGGGVYMAYKGSVIMEGGSIANNTAYKGTAYPDGSGRGGGVYLDGDALFTMKGGSIAGNTAGTRGGGIFLRSSAAVFKMNGGIVYGSDDPPNANIAQAMSGLLGHAVYDATSTPHVAYPGDVPIFPPLAP